MTARAYRCGLYLPGHDVHWIQAKLSVKRDAPLPEAGHLLEVRTDGVLFVEMQGAVYRLWHHDPARLELRVKVNKGRITYQSRFGLLRTSAGPGSHALFCVADADASDRRSCPTSPPAGSLPELLKKAGGFSVPGPEDLRMLDEGGSQ